jgi:HlyD family secretion protein
MKRFRRKLGPVLIGTAVIAFLLYAFLPRAVPIEAAAVIRGPIEVAVLEDGRTRIKERYVVTAPLSGQLLRIPLKAGDLVVAGGSPMAIVVPAQPDPLDARSLAQAQARLRAGEAAYEQAASLLERAGAAHELARKEWQRALDLHESQTVPREVLDRAEHHERIAAHERQASRFAVQIAGYEVEQARAALLFSQADLPPSSVSDRFDIRPPIDGSVLRVFQESATVVAPGTPLLELGDPADLEVEIDVLSPDAVRIRPGAKVLLEHWGGKQPLVGRVRHVEPAGFTKISALGVEEQRVWVIVDLVDPPVAWRELGDAFRVEARIIVEQAAEALKIPAGALFRRGQQWSVFVVDEGRARLRAVTVGLRNDLEAQVTDGLDEGDRVIVHPSDRVREGIRVAVQ